MTSSPHLRKLGTIDDCIVWLVDGERVRNELDIDFTCGGHHLVYPWYVPKGEIWIDNALGPLDATATLLHEAVEHCLMRDRKWNYDRAHDAASAAELPLRKRMTKARPRSIDVGIANRALEAWLVESSQPARVARWDK